MTKVAILHGLGQPPSDWEHVANYLENDTIRISLFEGIQPDDEVSLGSLYETACKSIEQIDGPFYLCGLSLGGLLTLMYATKESNPNLKGIIVSGAIYQSIPKLLNVIQRAVFCVLPKSNFESIGLNRKQMIHLMSSIEVDLEDDLRRVDKPTLVLCGEKDKMNLKSAREISHLIANATLTILKDGGHELNKDQSVAFSQQVNEFINSNGYD